METTGGCRNIPMRSGMFLYLNILEGVGKRSGRKRVNNSMEDSGSGRLFQKKLKIQGIEELYWFESVDFVWIFPSVEVMVRCRVMLFRKIK